ncbi:MAG TPA: aminotransferase class V-fold PLP-dependent enzyme, partial [Prolixibacteraceae bacterium]|nr:aminotransferase class V-fold PLP-dependent enzyme [Prolixibacteraceae bacterium]
MRRILRGKSREIVLDTLKLDKRKFTVVFCSPRNAGKLLATMEKEDYRVISSAAIGLPLGVSAVAVRKKALPEQIPFMTGGGTARLVGTDWVVRTKAPSRFEPGTPPIINVIAFARALQLTNGSAFTSSGVKTGDAEPVSSMVNGDEKEVLPVETFMEQLNHQVMGKNITVPGLNGPCPYVHFDNAASTPALLPVWDSFRKTLWLSETLKEEITENVRRIIASFLNAPPEKNDVLFTQNTTEAINLVAESYSREVSALKEPVVLNTLLEHNSDDLPWRDIPGVTMARIPVNADGFFDYEEMERLLREYNQDLVHGNKRIDLVAVCGASNVLGSFNDLERTSHMVHRYGARLLVDAAQLVAHRQVDISHCQIDYLVFSGHKIYAPFGTGVLVAKKGTLAFSPQEMATIQSLGEENTAGIAALGRSVSLLQRAGLEQIAAKESELTGHFLAKARKIPQLDIYGITDPASPDFPRKGGVISFSIKGWMPNRIAGQLAMTGIGIRNGC